MTAPVKSDIDPGTHPHKSLQLSQATRRSLRILQKEIKSVETNLFIVFGNLGFTTGGLVATCGISREHSFNAR